MTVFLTYALVNWWNKINLLYSNNSSEFHFSQYKSCQHSANTRNMLMGDFDNDGLIDLYYKQQKVQITEIFYIRTTETEILQNRYRSCYGVKLFHAGELTGLTLTTTETLIFCMPQEIRMNFFTETTAEKFFKITNSSLTSAGESWSGSWGDYDNDGDADVFANK